MQKVLPQCQILAVSKRPQRLPRRLKPAFLNKVGVEEEEAVLCEGAVDDALFVALGDNLLDPVQFARLERGREAYSLKVVELVIIEEAVLVDVAQLKDPRKRGHARRLERLDKTK